MAKLLRNSSKEVKEWQEQVKLLESQKFDLNKKYQHMEEAYKRDTSLFRNETIKRDEEYEEEKDRSERNI